MDRSLSQLERLAELKERYLAKQRGKFNIEKIAFKQQLEFINDQARLKALFCTRRAAKSYTGGLYLLREALNSPNCNVLYIALTRANAHGIIWKDVLRELDLKHGLNIKFNESHLTATLPNGSVIWVTGADTDENEMNKLLGRKYKLVILDEASMFSVNMHQLVYGILKPATADQRGTICLLGTSSNITRGLFYDITTGSEPGWSLHQWTAHDNPHVAVQWREELEDIAKNRPLFQETALYKQWYLNQWTIASDALVYKYEPGKNQSAHLPREVVLWHYVLGIDLGHSPDPSAFVVSAYSEETRELYFVHAEKHLEMDVTDVANKIKQLDAKYKFEVKVIDGSAKMAVAELNSRHGVNVIPADKANKEDFINLMNSDFIQARIKVLPGAKDLTEELSTLVWVTDNGIVKIPRKEHPSIPNHLTDAALYNWRHCYNYLQTVETKKPFVNWQKQESWEPQHIEKLAEAAKKEANPFDWGVQLEADEDLFDFTLDDQK